MVDCLAPSAPFLSFLLEWMHGMAGWGRPGGSMWTVASRWPWHLCDVVHYRVATVPVMVTAVGLREGKSPTGRKPYLTREGVLVGVYYVVVCERPSKWWCVSGLCISVHLSVAPAMERGAALFSYIIR